MSASEIKVNYDQMNEIETTLKTLQDRLQSMNTRLHSQMEELRPNFEGEAADRFFAEMDNSVVPRVQKMISAVENAAASVRQVSTIMASAEDQAGALFKR